MGGRILVVQPEYLGVFGGSPALCSSAHPRHGGRDGRQIIYSPDLGIVCLCPFAVGVLEVKSW